MLKVKFTRHPARFAFDIESNAYSVFGNMESAGSTCYIDCVTIMTINGDYGSCIRRNSGNQREFDTLANVVFNAIHHNFRDASYFNRVIDSMRQ